MVVKKFAKRVINKLKAPYAKALNKKYALNHIDKPDIQEIEIETVNRCNGTCPFCPVNVNEVQRPYAKMMTKLFYKIISDLADMEYAGKLSLYSNNEPFLDERILDFYKYAKNKLPKATMSIFTNGSLLTLSKFLELVKWCDKITIDNYNDAKVVNENLVEIYDYLEEHNELKERVSFSMRLQNEVLTSRGGQAPNKKGAKYYNEICLLPFRMLIIRPDGKISLCCNDALGKYTLGDVNNQSIDEIWNSEEYQKIRNEMLYNGRKNLLLCKNCDTRTKPFK